MMATFSYKCPNCGLGFEHTLNDERDIGRHGGHECLNLDCKTFMTWDDPDLSGRPQECTDLRHPRKKPGSVLPVRR
jgi:hypothetical protein